MRNRMFDLGADFQPKCGPVEGMPARLSELQENRDYDRIPRLTSLVSSSSNIDTYYNPNRTRV